MPDRKNFILKKVKRGVWKLHVPEKNSYLIMGVRTTFL
jgi:hypothetical protein